MFQNLKICLLALLIVCALPPKTAQAEPWGIWWKSVCNRVASVVVGPLPPYQFPTNNLLLRTPEPSDFPVFKAMFNDHLTARYTWFWLGENYWDVKKVQQKYGAFAWDQRWGRREDFTIQAENVERSVVGRLAIWNGPTKGSWELGITLHRDHWGKHYAEEAIREMARHVFEDLGGAELRFRTEPENEPMLRQYERMGIKKVIDAADDIPEPPLFHRYHHFVWSRDEWFERLAPPARFETPRLVLRPPVSADIPAMLKIANDYPANRYLGSRPRKGDWTLDEMRREFELLVQARYQGWRETLLIQKIDGGKEVIGHVSIKYVPGDRTWDMGIQVHHDYWGSHYAEEAMREMARHAFEDLGAKTIQFRTYPENMPMLRQYERMGIKKVIDASEMIPAAPYYVRYHTFQWTRDEWAPGE